MNNEKILYDYIKNHNGCIYCNYEDLAKELNCCITSIKKYKNALVKNNYINCKCKVINGTKKLILSLTKKGEHND